MDTVSKAVSRLIMNHEWWGCLATRLQPVETTEVKRIATDGKRLLVNMEWFNALSSEQQEFVVAHEVQHCALEHPFRLGDRDFEMANAAMDHVVNLDLINAGMTPVPDIFADRRFEGMAYERVYAILEGERATAQPPQQPQGGQGGASQQPQGGQGGASQQPQGGQGGASQQPQGGQGGNPTGTPQGPQGASEGGSTGDPKGAKGGQGGPNYGGTPQRSAGESLEGNSGGLGDGNKGVPGPSEGVPQGGQKGASQGDQGGTQGDDQRNWGQVYPARQEDEKEELQREWQKAVEIATMVSTKAGTMPGSVVRSLQAARETQEDLGQVLQRYFTQRSAYSYASPNKRMMAHGYKMPGRAVSGLEHVVVAVDTSGSINERMLDFCREKITEVMAMDTPPERVSVVYCDARVQAVREFTPGEELEFEPVGGGGTAFAPIFTWAEEQHDRVAVMIVITDLWGSDNDVLKEPDYPVVWVTPIQSVKKEPFGELVQVDVFARR